MRGRGEQVLKKLAWAFVAAAVVVIGCGGGGGGGSSTTSTTSTTSGSEGSFVKIPAGRPGQLAVSLLTGAGRAVGDTSAVIRRVSVSDGSEVEYAGGSLSLLLNGYTHQIVNVSVPTLSSRFFQNYLLQVEQIRVDNGTSFPDVFPRFGTNPLVQLQVPASIRVLPGRITSVAVRLDDTMFDTSQLQDEDIFQQDLWDAANLVENPVQGIDTLTGYLSDYVMFDISGMSSMDRPTLADGSTVAGKVYFSGDFVALSTGGNSGKFEVLTSLGFVNGSFGPVINLPNPGANDIGTFGTYTLLQPDPRSEDPETAPSITAMEGTYYRLSDVVGGLSSFEMITFPRSQERMVPDTQSGLDVLRELHVQDVVLIQRSGSTITNMYFGEIDFGQDQGDPTTIRAYPISQVDTGDAMNEIEGTVSGFRDTSGNAISLNVGNPQVRASNIQKIGSGQFTLRSGTDTVYGGPLPSGFPSSGRFLVFRK